MVPVKKVALPRKRKRKEIGQRTESGMLPMDETPVIEEEEGDRAEDGERDAPMEEEEGEPDARQEMREALDDLGFESCLVEEEVVDHMVWLSKQYGLNAEDFAHWYFRYLEKNKFPLTPPSAILVAGMEADVLIGQDQVEEKQADEEQKDLDTKKSDSKKLDSDSDSEDGFGNFLFTPGGGRSAKPVIRKDAFKVPGEKSESESSAAEVTVCKDLEEVISQFKSYAEATGVTAKTVTVYANTLLCFLQYVEAEEPSFVVGRLFPTTFEAQQILLPVSLVSSYLQMPDLPGSIGKTTKNSLVSFHKTILLLKLAMVNSMPV